MEIGPGTYSFTLRVTDSAASNAHSATQLFTWTISPLNLQYNNLPVSLNNSTVVTPLVYKTPYTQPLLALGGSGSYTWTSSVPLPTSLVLDPSTGVVSGTPLNIGNFNGFNGVTIRAVDGTGSVVQSGLNVNIAGPTPNNFNVNFGTGSNLGTMLLLDTIQQGNASPLLFNPNGGTGPYTITALTPLPPGCAIMTGSAIVSGGVPGTTYVLGCTPITSGTFAFALEIRDSATPVANVGARTFQLTVVPFTRLSPKTLADASVGVPYVQQVIVFGSSTVVWSVSPSSPPPPPGFSMSPTGLISFTPGPGTAGNYNFSLVATDTSTGLSFNFNFSMKVSNISISDPQILPTVWVAGAPINYTFAAVGGGSKNWSQSGLPFFLTLNPSTGAISSAFASIAGTYSFTITVSDGGVPLSRQFTLFVRRPNPTVLDYPVASALLADVAVGQSVVSILAPTGGLPPYTWSVAPGSTLPTGLSLRPVSMLGSPVPANIGVGPDATVLFGAVATPGRYAFDLIVTDAAGAQTQRTFTLNVTAVNILPGAPRDATTGVAYAEQFTGVGGTPPYSFTVSQGNLFLDTLPPGLSLSSTGLLAGVSTSTGNYSFVLQIQDSAGQTFARTYSFTVNNSSGLRVTSYNAFNTKVGFGAGSSGFLGLTTSGASTYTWSIAPNRSSASGGVGVLLESAVRVSERARLRRACGHAGRLPLYVAGQRRGEPVQLRRPHVYARRGADAPGVAAAGVHEPVRVAERGSGCAVLVQVQSGRRHAALQFHRVAARDSDASGLDVECGRRLVGHAAGDRQFRGRIRSFGLSRAVHHHSWRVHPHGDFAGHARAARSHESVHFRARRSARRVGRRSVQSVPRYVRSRRSGSVCVERGIRIDVAAGHAAAAGRQRCAGFPRRYSHRGRYLRLLADGPGRRRSDGDDAGHGECVAARADAGHDPAGHCRGSVFRVARSVRRNGPVRASGESAQRPPPGAHAQPIRHADGHADLRG